MPDYAKTLSGKERASFAGAAAGQAPAPSCPPIPDLTKRDVPEMERQIHAAWKKGEI